MTSSTVFLLSVAIAASSVAVSAQRMLLASFDGSMTRTWQDTNDPVMGGQSVSTFVVKNNSGIFDGNNKIVPSLKAPGFCNVRGEAKAVDISEYVGGSIVIVARTSTPQYMGFKMAFGGKGIPKTSIFGGGSFKAGFNVTSSSWQNVSIPLHRFSYDWSGYTGRCDTKDPSKGVFPGQQHYCCDSLPQKDEVCPQAKYLKDVTDLEIWAEGIEGIFHIEVNAIYIDMAK